MVHTHLLSLLSPCGASSPCPSETLLSLSPHSSRHRHHGHAASPCGQSPRRSPLLPCPPRAPLKYACRKPLAASSSSLLGRLASASQLSPEACRTHSRGLPGRPQTHGESSGPGTSLSIARALARGLLLGALLCGGRRRALVRREALLEVASLKIDKVGLGGQVAIVVRLWAVQDGI